MKWKIGDRLPELTSETGELPVRNSEPLVFQNKVTSELYFAKSAKHLIDTAHMRRFETREITIIDLSFTSVRISIALPGCGVSLGGGKPSRRGTAKPSDGPTVPDAAVWHDNRAKPLSGR
jgi:hypothetical protein